MTSTSIRANLFGLALLASVPALSVQAAPFDLDPSHAVLVFEVNHLGFSDTIGTFNAFSADLDIDVDEPEKSQAKFVFDAASVDTNWDARDEHLRNADFLNVEVHKEVVFEVTGISLQSDTTALVTGDLTLLGVTRPVTFDTQLNNWGPHPFREEQQVIGFTAEGEIQRSEWGMTTFSPAVGETVKLKLSFEATPKG